MCWRYPICPLPVRILLWYVNLQTFHLDGVYDSYGIAKVVVSSPVSATYYRLVIERADKEQSEGEVYIGMRMDLLGCETGVSGDMATGKTCEIAAPPAENERQFLVSPTGQSVIYCAYDSRKYGMDRTYGSSRGRRISLYRSKRQCYSSPDGDTWNSKNMRSTSRMTHRKDTHLPLASALPADIGSLTCIRKDTGRVYGISQSGLKFVTSDDGGATWLPITSTEYEKGTLGPDCAKSLSVPYSPKGDPSFGNLKQGNWTGNVCFLAMRSDLIKHLRLPVFSIVRRLISIRSASVCVDFVLFEVMPQSTTELGCRMGLEWRYLMRFLCPRWTCLNRRSLLI